MRIFDKLFNGKSEDSSSEIITVIPQNWSILQGKNKGNTMLIRKNVGCDKIAGIKNYSISCGIAFKLLSPTENGFSDIENEPELNNLEKDIFDFFEADLNSIVPLVITTSGFKEYVLYTKDVNEFKI